MRRLLIAMVAVALVMGATVSASGAGAASGTQLIADPQTSLVDRQATHVTGTGFAPKTTLHLYECRSGDCESLDASTFTDASGRFSTVVHVKRALDAFGYPVDCAVTVCQLAASSATANARAYWQDMAPRPEPAFVSLAFAPATASVIRNRRLTDGNAVTVEGRDLVPGQTVYVYECSGICTAQLPGSAVVDRDGRVTITTTVHRWIY